MYEYFDDYTEVEIDAAFEELTEEEIEVLHRRYGNNLKEPVYNSNIGKSDTDSIYGTIIPKIKRILRRNAARRSKIDDSKKLVKKAVDENNKQENICSNREEENKVVQDVVPALAEPTRELELNAARCVVEEATPVSREIEYPANTMDNYVKVLEIFDTPEFREMTKGKDFLECFVLALQLGYIDDKYFFPQSIANFLGMDVAQVNEITKNGLLEYKERLNQMIDDAIEKKNVVEKGPYVKVMKQNYEQN